jgi:hypothetical protein
MLDNSGDGVSSNNILSLTNKLPRRLPSLKELAVDPDIRAFLKIVHEEDLREEAIRLLEKAIEKSSRILPTRPSF